MTQSGNEPLEYAASSGAPGRQPEEADRLAAEEMTDHAPAGYDDRQESLEEADRDLFARKDNEDPEARYKPEDEPRSEPRKQPQQQD